MATEVTDASFKADVLGAPRPVVVDFWAPWCGPCKAVESTLEGLAAEHGDRIAFARLNVDENPVVASRYGVLSLPTTILFEGGEPRQTVVGARSRAHYERAWERWLTSTR
jgi:thioredoxin 1